MSSTSHNSANLSGAHLKQMRCGTESSPSITKIFWFTLKQSSSPHCRFSFACGKERQYLRIDSAFMAERGIRFTARRIELQKEIEMQARQLGKSDLHITPVGYGAWAIGGAGWEFGWGPQNDADSISAIHRALELGVNWIDTAAVYGLGHSEEIVARAL